MRKLFLSDKNRVFTMIFLMLAAASVLFATGTREQSASGPVSIEFWALPTSSEAGPPPDNWKAFQIVKEKLNIDWKLTLLPSSAGDRTTKINAAAAANSLPDMFYIPRSDLVSLINTGTVAAVDSLYSQMPNWVKIYAGTDGREYTTINGKSYGIPYMGGGQPKKKEC